MELYAESLVCRIKDYKVGASAPLVRRYQDPSYRDRNQSTGRAAVACWNFSRHWSSCFTHRSEIC